MTHANECRRTSWQAGGRLRVIVVALVGESALAIVALLWIVARALPVQRGTVVSGVAIGAATAMFLALINYYVLRHAPDLRWVASLRRVYDDVLRPLFADIKPLDVAAISVAAGVGEELLFRGAAQHEFGLVPASVAFGLMHFGGGGTAVFGVWAGVLGLLLGVVAMNTGGLVAPTVAHVLYDAAALAYVRWGSTSSGASLPDS